jgi:hypothetical protein
MNRIAKLVMNPLRSTWELLRAKDSYNRISLQITWTHAGRNEKNIKFDRLKLDYGDSRIDAANEKHRYLCEGLKICK